MRSIAIEIGEALHILELSNGVLDLSEYPQMGQDVLQAAYDAGRWHTYTPPTMIPESLPPDWKTFRLALLKSKSFRLWSELLPGTWREDLKLAAMAGNAEALQGIYDYCKSLSLPGLASTSEWQALANKSNIPVTF